MFPYYADKQVVTEENVSNFDDTLIMTCTQFYDYGKENNNVNKEEVSY